MIHPKEGNAVAKTLTSLTLMGRTEPRDLKPEFERKAKNKGHDPVQFEVKVLAKEKNLGQSWQRKLEDQVYDLPKFVDVFREAKRHFKL
ncbi:hypothetical protein ACX0G9_09915 [Flavitalea flava]